MSQAMYTSMTGMSAGQQQITVVSDNIANMNTTAYKESQANFQDIWYDTRTSGTTGNGTRGGTNPLQFGMGTMISSISKNWNASTINTTGRTTDMALQGNGFFTLRDAQGQIYYSRAGNFFLDGNSGYLCDPSGKMVMGTNTSLAYNSSTIPVKIPPLLEANPQAQAAGTLANKIASELNGAKLSAGDFTIKVTDGGAVTDVTVNLADTSSMTVAGLVASINTQLPAGVTCAIVDGGVQFQTTGTVTGLEFVSGTSNFVQATQLSAAANVGGNYDSKTLDYSVEIKPVTDMSNALIYKSFSVAQDGTIEATYGNGDRITVYTDPADGISRLKYITGDIEIMGPDDCTADPNVLVPDNLKIQTANVVNPEGLVAVGSNMYTLGPNSGNIYYSQANDNGVGGIKTGGLESSNVDLARQFSNMILAQRAIEANSRVFDTANNILQTLVYLGRG